MTAIHNIFDHPAVAMAAMKSLHRCDQFAVCCLLPGAINFAACINSFPAQYHRIASFQANIRINLTSNQLTALHRRSDGRYIDTDALQHSLRHSSDALAGGLIELAGGAAYNEGTSKINYDVIHNEGTSKTKSRPI